VAYGVRIHAAQQHPAYLRRIERHRWHRFCENSVYKAMNFLVNPKPELPNFKQ
jgi:hypothetical protein